VRDALHDEINRQQKQLQERDKATRDLEVTNSLLCRINRETFYETYKAIRMIKELENKVQQDNCGSDSFKTQ
jgi:hypothetical protein